MGGMNIDFPETVGRRASTDGGDGVAAVALEIIFSRGILREREEDGEWTAKVVSSDSGGFCFLFPRSRLPLMD